MVEKTKVHFAWNEVKTSIIKFVLESSGPVTEPAIREHLINIYGAADQGLINRQLHTLKSSGCIEKVAPVIKSRSNFWNITTFKNLRNIKVEFPEISLNNFHKSVNVVIQVFGYDEKSTNHYFRFIQLWMSISFFNECMKTDIQSMLAGIREIHEMDEEFKNERRIEEILNKLKNELNIEDSDYIFQQILEENEELMLDLSPNESVYFVDRFLEKLKEKNMGPSDASILENPDRCHDLYKKIKEASELMYQRKYNFDDLLYNLLFEHFYNHDVIIGVATDEEKEFAKNTKTIVTDYRAAIATRNHEEIKKAGDSLHSKQQKIIDDFKAEHKI